MVRGRWEGRTRAGCTLNITMCMIVMVTGCGKAGWSYSVPACLENICCPSFKITINRVKAEIAQNDVESEISETRFHW